MKRGKAFLGGWVGNKTLVKKGWGKKIKRRNNWLPDEDSNLQPSGR